MGMTITEKILADHAGKESVKSGDIIWVSVDILMTHDVCGPGTIGIFEEEFGSDAKVFDPEKIVIIPDHYIFTADPKAHRNIEILRKFVKRTGIKHFFDADFVKGEGIPRYCREGSLYSGVCHITLAEKGFCLPGRILIGTDSHTCTAGAFGLFSTGVGNTEAAFIMGKGRIWLRVPETMKFILDGSIPEYIMAKDIILTIIADIGVDGATYKAMEFSGEAVQSMNMDERMTITNMAIEAGGKSGIIAADDITMEYLKERGIDTSSAKILSSDPDAEYFSVSRYDISRFEPVVAAPHSPANKVLAREVDQKIDRAYIGSCTGGKITDFIMAARLIAGRRVSVDTFIVPATVEVDKALDEEKIDGKSLRDIFEDAGCFIGPPSCGACLGGPIDTFGRVNEPIVCISTTNRNFPGRMGHKEAKIFLASPLTVAASAIKGRITDPREVM